MQVTNGRRIALLIIESQVVATVFIAIVFLLASGGRAATSALIGGGICAIASLVVALATFREVIGNDPRRILRNVYRGEAAKLGITALLLIAAFKVGVRAGPFFTAYIASLFVYWVVLLRTRVS